ncbi:hypothetical protein [Mycobacterium sp.]|uniref:hypothetical protein n=1 Tax=Mycobacterium sp. TaxID=1785 RepID=UPI003D6AD227
MAHFVDHDEHQGKALVHSAPTNGIDEALVNGSSRTADTALIKDGTSVVDSVNMAQSIAPANIAGHPPQG